MRTRERWGARARIATRGLLARARQVLTTEPGGAAPDAGTQASARALAEEATRLRGGVAKVAQLTGYLDAFDLESDAQASLAGLWDRMSPMTPAAVADVLRADLGGGPDDLFARWDATPLAAASLGQVHAAEDADGTRYAVKVQYPDVAAALRDDVAARGLVRQLAPALGADLGAAAIEELRAAILGELDYAAEADAMERFGRAFAGDRILRVPSVDRRRSAARVLTMERMEGLRIPDAARAAEPVRAGAAAAMIAFSWRGPLLHGLVHGDPNPGNYLVVPAGVGQPGAVAFLDYGCTAVLSDATREAERSLWRALLQRDPMTRTERFRQELHASGMVEARTLHGDAYQEWETLIAAPFAATRSRQPCPWTPGYAAALMAATRRLSVAGELRIPASRVLLWRQRLGLPAVLAMLGAPADARGALEAALGPGG